MERCQHFDTSSGRVCYRDVLVTNMNQVFLFLGCIISVLCFFTLYNNRDHNCKRREHPSQSYGTPKSAIKSLILVVEQFCMKHFLIIFQF